VELPVAFSLAVWKEHRVTGSGYFVSELPARTYPEKETTVGQPATIRCHSSTAKPVNWWYQRTEDTVPIELVVNSTLVNGNNESFSLDYSTYDLTLKSAKQNDSGIYSCVEDTAFGTRHITHLTVAGIENSNLIDYSA